MFAWQVRTDPLSPAVPVVTLVDAPAGGSAATFGGTGLVRPFRRASSDFATASDVALVVSNAGQVLGTPVGSLPWDPTFGSKLHLLRQRILSPTLAEQARHFVIDPLRRWVPRARPRSVIASARDKTLQVDVEFSVLDAARSKVLVPSVTLSVALG